MTPAGTSLSRQTILRARGAKARRWAALSGCTSRASTWASCSCCAHGCGGSHVAARTRSSQLIVGGRHLALAGINDNSSKVQNSCIPPTLSPPRAYTCSGSLGYTRRGKHAGSERERDMRVRALRARDAIACTPPAALAVLTELVLVLVVLASLPDSPSWCCSRSLSELCACHHQHCQHMEGRFFGHLHLWRRLARGMHSGDKRFPGEDPGGVRQLRRRVQENVQDRHQQWCHTSAQVPPLAAWMPETGRGRLQERRRKLHLRGCV